MRFEMGFQDRAYAANLFRRRRDELRQLASQKSMSGIRQDLEAEAAYAEDTATRFDRGGEGGGTNNETEPASSGR